ncbi:MAG: hypothetical protein K0Q64_1965 [Nitrobacter vulgaris]|jgi:hypothetical protein|nr:hypothetical protein [Nitrobacter vulgaris]
MAARTFLPASERRPADLRRAINAQIGLLTANYSGNFQDRRIFNPRDVTHMTPPLA